VAASIKIEQLTKINFFRGPSVGQIKNWKTNKSLEITLVMRTTNRRSKRYSKNFHEFLRCSADVCFRIATSPNLTSLKLEVLPRVLFFKAFELGAVI
jgi:hypothetical protein